MKSPIRLPRATGRILPLVPTGLIVKFLTFGRIGGRQRRRNNLSRAGHPSAAQDLPIVVPMLRREARFFHKRTYEARSAGNYLIKAPGKDDQ